MKVSLMMFAVIFLAGCQNLQERFFPNPEDSPFVAIPVNSKLVLNESVEVPASLGRVHLQAGKVKPLQLIDPYYANCAFESKKVLPTAQTIEPDTFVITRVTQKGNWSMRERRIRTQPAGFYLSSGGGASPEPWSTFLYLRSEKQPDIHRMTCTYWEEPTNAYHLSIRQIRKALGEIVTLEIPAGALT